MNIIKLNAIDSTNSYIKNHCVKNNFESYTVVTANYQTAGKGQLGTKWLSDDSKNLIFSILIKFETLKTSHQFYLSMAVSLGIITTLKQITGKKFYVKWPNDIMAEKDKISGILIENKVRANFIKHAVIGIGLNVNQIQFPDCLGAVTSVKKISGSSFNRDELLKQIVISIKNFVDFIERKEFDSLKKRYVAALYKMNTPAMFEDKNGTIFLAKIVDVSEDGKLLVALENDLIHAFNLKEIKFVDR